ncbi:hypothetical protein HY413_02245 [Candidatus Kaiserbacteria bacterium]|nr:hypothetical protein [Candidatus Kaiserbacteria bacterium]
MKFNIPLIFSTLFAGAAATAFLVPAYVDNLQLSPAAVSFARREQAEPPALLKPIIEHVATPKQVKGLYMSQCAAGSDEFRTHLFALADDTEINSIVVDLKDYSGTVAFSSEIAEQGGKGCTVLDFRTLVKTMHEHGIYVIGRLTVFQDPLYTKAHPELAVQKKSGGVWHDYKGLAFVDVGAEPFWDYIIGLAREAHALGIDEINFDYIRYPSDGPMSEAVYAHSNTTKTKAENMERFFSYLSQAVRIEEDNHMPVLSADLFGMVTTNSDDLNIGQVLERALPYFDYVAPMVYPSHYPPHFNGWDNPNNHVYGVVQFSMSNAVRRAEATTTPIAWMGGERIGTTTPAIYTKPAYSPLKLRPWLQDFDYGGTYGSKEVREQIQATYDVGLYSWMLWDAANRYTKSALEVASSTIDETEQ